MSLHEKCKWLRRPGSLPGQSWWINSTVKEARHIRTSENNPTHHGRITRPGETHQKSFLMTHCDAVGQNQDIAWLTYLPRGSFATWWADSDLQVGYSSTCSSTTPYVHHIFSRGMEVAGAQAIAKALPSSRLTELHLSSNGVCGSSSRDSATDLALQGWFLHFHRSLLIGSPDTSNDSGKVAVPFCFFGFSRKKHTKTERSGGICTQFVARDHHKEHARSVRSARSIRVGVGSFHR